MCILAQSGGKKCSGRKLVRTVQEFNTITAIIVDVATTFEHAISADISSKHRYLKECRKSGNRVMHLCKNYGVFSSRRGVVCDSKFAHIH